MDAFSYMLTFIEGILTFISPCILPMLPVYFLYLAGTAEGDGKIKPLGKSRLVVNSFGFVIGFTIVFILLGATVTTLGQFLAGHRDLLRKISGVVMMLFGLHFIGILKLGFMNMEKRFEFKLNNLHLPGSILFGMVFGLGWTPCLGAFLGSALILAGNSESVLQGISLLFIYSVGLGLPFILSSILFEKARSVFKKIQAHIRIINIISGILLMAAGILVFTDSIRYLRF
ncbi:MAG: cytochrome c biogenesis protein CcdA [Ruminiclostridium sp.]|nr:cytochrome c biogenesis protein CcdA [Ruminiclostridium sp.]